MKRLIVLLAVSLPLAAQTYVAVGAAAARPARVTLLDRDCSSSQPAAVFGCGSGNDGVPLGARGELRHGRAFDIAVGREAGRARAEIVFTSRSGFALDAAANFTGVAGQQPVSARARSRSLFLAAAIDVGPRSWRLRPFVAAGAGVARNDIGQITFAFPGIAPDAVTITRGGRTTGFSWTGGAGVSIALGGIAVDVAMRYVDLGHVGSHGGEAAIVRPTRTLRLDIGGTEMRWRAREVGVSVRRKF
jgi:opacity protein-like surface antigen